MEKSSRKDRAAAFLHFRRNRPANFHTNYPLVGLNAKCFESSVVDSLQKDLSNKQSWSGTIKEMSESLGKLKDLNAAHLGNLSSKDRAAFGTILLTIRQHAKTMDSNIGNEIASLNETKNKNKSISSKFISNLAGTDANSQGLKKMELARKTVGEITAQADRLFDMLSESEQLTATIDMQPENERPEFVANLLTLMAGSARKLDPTHEEIRQFGEEDETKVENTIANLFDEASRRNIEISHKVSRNDFTHLKKLLPENMHTAADVLMLPEAARSDVIMETLHVQAQLLRELESAPEDEDNEENLLKVANKITDLFIEAGKRGVDLSEKLSPEERTDLARGMGKAKRFNADTSLSDEQKKARIGIQKNLAMQTADLLSDVKLNNMLDRLATPADGLSKAIAQLQSRQPNSISAASAEVEEAYMALKRIDKSESSRLANYSGPKGEKAATKIADLVGQIKNKGTELQGAIDALNASQANGLSKEDLVQLRKTSAFLKHVKAETDLLTSSRG